MGGMEIYEKLRAVPEEAKKPIQGGRLKGFTDINPMWRIKMLTSVFGPCGFGWYIDQVERWTESHNGVTGAFVKIHLYVKSGDEWSKPIVGIGGSSLVAQEKSGLVFSDEAYKMAYTDAISVACKALGMAADVYFSKDTRSSDNMTKYDKYCNLQPVNQQPVNQQPVNQQPVKQQPVKQQPVKQQPVKQQPVKQQPVKQTLVRGSDAWLKFVKRAAKGEEGIMEKLRTYYRWDEQIDADFAEDVFNYNLDNNGNGK